MDEISDEILEYISQYYSLLLLSIIPAGFIGSLYLGNTSLFVYGFLMVGPPSIFAAWWYSNNEFSWESLRSQRSQKSIAKNRLYSKIFIIVFFFSIVSLSLTTYRRWHYFLLIAVAAALLFTMVLNNAKNWHILIHTILLSTNTSWSLTLNYPLFFGGTDLLPHIVYSELTYESGHILSQNVSSYAFFPLYHILVSQSTNIFGLSIHNSLFLVTGVAFSFSVLFVYLLSKVIFGDEIALFACVTYIFYPVIIYYNSYTVTRVFAYFGFLALLYLFIRSNESKMRNDIMIFIMLIYVSLVHQVSNIQIIALLVFIYFINKYITGGSPWKASYLAIYLTIFVGYLVLVSVGFTQTFLSQYVFFSSGTPSGVVGEAERSFQPLLQYLNSHLLTALILIGIGYLLTKRDEMSTKQSSILLLLLCSIVIYIPNPIQTSEFLWNTLRFDRFMLLLSPFVIMAIAVSFREISGSKGRKVAIPIFFIFVLTSSVAVAPHSIAPDTEELDWTGPPQHFTVAELESFDFVSSHSSGTILSDFETERYFIAYRLARMYDITVLQMSTPEEQDFQDDLLVREHRLPNGGITLGTSGNRFSYSGYGELMDLANKGNRFYDNSDVSIYDMSNT